MRINLKTKTMEIRFRALKDDISNCQFVYGQLVYDAAGNPRITEVDKSGKELTFHTCIKGTEGQFTGREDAEINGTQVYEGDIIENCDTKYLQVVYWNTNECAWYCRYVYDESRIVSLADSLGNLNKVIGNIYENPELLSQ